MVAIAQTIVDIDTVMIKFLYTFSAYLTVEGTHRFDDLAVETEILKVNILFITNL